MRSVEGITFVFMKSIKVFSQTTDCWKKMDIFSSAYDRVCVKREPLLDKIYGKHLPVYRRNVPCEPLHKLMTYTQMIAYTEFVSRQCLREVFGF